jgi:hypothetical protein
MNEPLRVNVRDVDAIEGVLRAHGYPTDAKFIQDVLLWTPTYKEHHFDVEVYELPKSATSVRASKLSIEQRLDWWR